MTRKGLLLLLAALSVLSCRVDRSADEHLDGLDAILVQSPTYRQRKEDRLDVLRSVFQASRDPQTKADVALELGDT